MIFAAGARWRSATLGVWLGLCLSPCGIAQVAIPPLHGHITDSTGTLTQAQTLALEQSLTAYEARKGSQLAVLMVNTTAPEAIEPFALRVAEQWKLGRKQVDDGLLVVVAKDDRTLRIEVGYGLEGAISDIVGKRIISETIVPKFKQNDFYGGIEAGLAQIMGVIDGEPLPEPQRLNRDGVHGVQQFMPFLFIVALVLGAALRTALGRVPGALITGALVSVMAWFFMGTLVLALLVGMVALLMTLVGVGGLFYGMGGGRGGGGGFGGSFRGGGGGFGGGGASGRW